VAVEGPIKYIDVPFDSAYWTKNIQSPFRRALTRGGGPFSPRKELLALAGDSSLPLQQADNDFVLDRPGGTQLLSLKCVIVGMEKADQLSCSQKHYVILIMPTDISQNCTTFEKVGVAIIEGRYI
jgi:hypothetical protein